MKYGVCQETKLSVSLCLKLDSEIPAQVSEKKSHLSKELRAKLMQLKAVINLIA